MTTSAKPTQRAPLSRRGIIQAAVRYIDAHGLDGLSMNKLGDELGVKGMSLYNHVTNKHDLLDGVVELLWEEIEHAAPIEGDWREGYRSVARAIRDAFRRHPNAAPLSVSQQVIPEPALRLVRAHVTAATGSGMSKDRAYALLRTLTTYALGTGLNEVAWGVGLSECGAPTVENLLRPGISAELAGVAEIFCGQSDPDAEFELGLDLMVRGIDGNRQHRSSTR